MEKLKGTMTPEILLSVIILIVLFFACSHLIQTRQGQRRTREIRILENELFALQKKRYDLLANNFNAGAAEHQKLLEEEIRIRLAIGELNPQHEFLKNIPSLLQDCTDKKGFVEWVHAELHGRERKKIRFVT